MNLRTAAYVTSLVALAALCILTGCSTPDQGGSKSSAPGGKPRVALVMKSLANEFFKTMEDGARAHQKAHADQYELICSGIKDEQDVAQQINIVDQMIAQEVKVLVIAPADSKALVPVCKKAAEAKIIVVNIDNKFDTAALEDKKIKIPFVGPDNRKGAKLAGDYLATKLKKGDEVAIVEGVPNAFNGVQRKLGFEDAMNAAGMKIVSSQSANWMPDQAEKVVAGMLVQNPDLKALLCANDNMAMGAVAALKSVNKAGQVLVVGYDNITAVQSLMKEGKILCTVDQHADQIAVFGIEYGLEILNKKSTAADKETPVDLVKAESSK